MIEGFFELPDEPEEILDRLYGYRDIKVGRARVIYGYRLRAGYIDDGTWYDLDICCGDKDEVYNEMFEKVCTIVKYNFEHELPPFSGIPSHSHIKPYPKDPQFCETIDKLYEKCSKLVVEG